MKKSLPGNCFFNPKYKTVYFCVGKVSKRLNQDLYVIRLTTNDIFCDVGDVELTIRKIVPDSFVGISLKKSYVSFE